MLVDESGDAEGYGCEDRRIAGDDDDDEVGHIPGLSVAGDTTAKETAVMVEVADAALTSAAVVRVAVWSPDAAPYAEPYLVSVGLL